MIRELRLTDVLLQLLPGSLAAQDLATSPDEITGSGHRLALLKLASWSVAARNQEHHLVSADAVRLNALAVLQPRRGPRAWEISHLFAVPDADTGVTDLLKHAARFVASRRGECLFLRVPLNGTGQRLAERSGFRMAYSENVFTLARHRASEREERPLNLRPPLSADAYNIFRLYNATFPLEARAVMGLTLDQWHDANERGRGLAREYLWVDEDQIRGWVRLRQHRDWVMVDAMLHPDESERAPAFASYIAQLARGHRHACWVVPSHEPVLARVLSARGWQHSSSYAVMAMVVARHIQNLGFAPARAS